MNQLTIIGNLTKDPIVREGEYGKLCFFTVAVNNKQKDKASDFFSVRTSRKQAEACEKYLSKGRSVTVRGPVHMESYGDEGNKRYTMTISAEEVEFLSSGNGQSRVKKNDGDEHNDGYTEVEDDELPFF